jgi:hypothetical protein
VLLLENPTKNLRERSNLWSFSARRIVHAGLVREGDARLNKVRLTDHISCENSNVCGLRHRLEATIAYSRTIHPHPDVSLLIAGKCSLKLDHARYAFTSRTWVEPSAQGRLGRGSSTPYSTVAYVALRKNERKGEREESKEPTVQCLSFPLPSKI